MLNSRFPMAVCLLLSSLAFASPSFRALAANASATPSPITVACMLENEPLSFMSKTGEPAGLMIDLWRLWGEKEGRPIKFFMGNWQDTLNALKSGRADIHFSMYITPERARWAKFGPAISPGMGGLLLSAAAGEHITDPSQVGSATIAVLEGSLQEEYLREHLPKIRLLVVKNGTEMFMAVVKGKAAGLSSNFPSAYGTIDRLGLNSVFMPLAMPLFMRNLHPAVLRNRDDLARLMDEGLSRITRAEMMTLEERWIRNPAHRVWSNMPRPLLFTPEERSWLAHHTTLRVAMEDSWHPVEFVDSNGLHNGVGMNIMQLIGRYANVSIQPVSANRLKEKDKNRTVDVVPFLEGTPSKDGPWLLTNPFLQLPLAVVTSDTKRLVTTAADLRGQTVVVHDHAGLAEYLRVHMPNANIITVDGLSDGLAAVQSGKADAMVDLRFPWNMPWLTGTFVICAWGCCRNCTTPRPLPSVRTGRNLSAF